MKNLNYYIYKLLFLLVFLFTGAFLSAASKQPNILFVIADDCTFRDIGCYGGQAHTPTINQLAKEGMLFKRCFQASPMCSPTRHNIYTGLYPVKSGAYPNHTFAKNNVKSIVHYLKPLGYRVALSGKTHISPKEVFPFEYSAINKKKGKKEKKQSVIDFGAVEKLMSDCSQSKTPFALFACSNDPHSPWNKGKEYRYHYNAKKVKLRPYMVDTPTTRKEYVNYLAEITFFDNEVKRLLDLLKKYDLEKDTLVMVVSEQGNSFPFAKWTCYDSGIQSAMLARWPGKVPAGSETDAMVEYVDICPTFVEAAKGTPDKVLDGKSFLPVLKGEKEEHKSHVFGIQTCRGIFEGPHHYPIRSVRDEKYKLILNLDPEAEFYNTINGKGWFKEWEAAAKSGKTHAIEMISRLRKRPGIELYDVSKDSYEMSNLAENPEYTQVIEKLRKKLDEWMESQGDKGLETELAAFERMGGGNEEFKEWRKAHGGSKKKKRKH